MSENNNNSESFDFDFDSLNTESPSENAGSSAFDLDNPFGDDPATSGNETRVSADSPHLNDSLPDDSFGFDSTADSTADEFGEGGVPPIDADAETGKKKKGFLGGIFGSKKTSPKGEKTAKSKKEKREKVVKDKETAESAMPRDWETILCIAFSVFLLVSLLMFNIATFFTSGNSMWQTLCFLGAFNLVGLAAAAVPILFYKFPKERTLPNVMLGIATVAMFTSLLIAVTEFYRYSFILTP